MTEETDEPSRAHDRNQDPKNNYATSGLDPQGQFRIGERLSLAVRGEGLVLKHAHGAREVEVSEQELSGLLEDEYFTEHKGEQSK